MFIDFTKQKNYNLENSNYKLLPNGIDSIKINNQTYIFKRYSKSRFFNLNENEKQNSKIETSNRENNIISFNQLLSNEEDSLIKKNKNKKNKKSIIERKGDWICFFCKNFNFSFREICNRCHKTKYKTIIMLNKAYFLDLNNININKMKNKILNN
jgi:hypothetical protein